MGRLVWNATYRELYSLKYTLGKTYHCLKFIFPSFLVHNKQVMGLFKHFSPKWGERLIKIHSFFVNSEVRNVEICTYFLERAKKKKCLFRGNGMTLTISPPWSRYEFYVISLKIIFLFSLVRNVTEKCISVSTVAPMTNDYTLWHVPFFALNSLPSRRKVNEKSPGGG